MMFLPVGAPADDVTTPGQSDSAPQTISAPHRPLPGWAVALMAALVLAVGMVAYSEGNRNGFTNWDDNWLITENRHIRELSIPNLVTIFNPFAPQEIREELGNEYLPVRDLSYAINYTLDGYRPAGYHTTNLFLHLMTSLLVMLLCTRLTGRQAAGFVAGLLFAAHPVHVEAVSWLSSRKDMLATFFALLSLNLYLVARSPRKLAAPGQSFITRAARSSRLALLLAVLCFALGLLSKMHAVVVAAIVPLLEIFFARRLAPVSAAKRVLAALPFAALALAFTLLAMKIGTGLMREPYGDSLYHTWLTALAALNRDFTVLAFGAPLQAAVDMELRTGPTPQSIGGALALLTMLGLGIVGFWRREKGDGIWPLLGFCALAFLAALAPVSNFFVQIGTVFAERYLYLPSVAVALGVAAAGIRLWDGVANYPVAGPVVRGGLVAALAALTAVYVWQTREQVKVWYDSTTLWTSVLKSDPVNHIAHFNLAREKQEQAQDEPDETRREKLLEDARHHLGRALEVAEEAGRRTYRYDEARVYGALALLEIRRDRPKDALMLLEAAAKVAPQPWRRERGQADIEAVLAGYRGLALSRLDRHEEAVKAFRECLQKSNRYASARINLASELARAGGPDRFERALAELDQYDFNRGKDSLSLQARARITYAEFDDKLRASGKSGEKSVPAEFVPLLERARALHRELLSRLRRESAPARVLAAALLEAADVMARGVAGDETAEQYLRESLKLDSSRRGTRYLLARLLSERGGERRVDATRLIDEELALHPDFGPARTFRALGLLQAGLNESASLKARWSNDYTLAHPGEPAPTWAGLVRAFFADREPFRAGLRRVFAIFKQAADLDPTIEAGSGEEARRLPALIGEFGYQAGLGLWHFGGEEGRRMAEELLRLSFNLEPVEGPVSEFLTVIYLELAERAVREGDRDELQKLMKNMLLLSEAARKVMARRLYRQGFAISQGEELKEPLTPEARKMLAAEFMRTAVLLDEGQIHALDWLKKYYEEEGKLEDALEIYGKFEEALKDRPDLLSGVWLAKAQTLFDLGQRLTKKFQEAIDRGDQDAAGRMSARAITLYSDCVRTLDQNLARSGPPSSQVLRIKGAALQRLAYFDFGRAAYYFGLAIDNYSRAPLDFGDELSEVLRKRSLVSDDPYKRREDLKRALYESPPGKDTSWIKEALEGVEQRILADEARAELEAGRPQKALERLAVGGDFSASMLMRLRGDVYATLADAARKTGDRDEQDRWLVLTAQDYVRAYTDIEALVKGGEMYLGEIALARAEGDAVNIKARQALERADRLISRALETLEPGDTSAARLRDFETRARTGLRRLDGLASTLLNTAHRLFSEGRHDDALDRVGRALNAGGDNPDAWHLRGRIMALRSKAARERGDSRAAEENALDAKAAFNTALRLEPPLTSQVLALQLDMAELALDAFLNRRDALFWLDAATRRMERMEPGLRPDFQKRLDLLARRAR